MASLRDLALGKSDLFKVDPRNINIDPGYNVRGFNTLIDDDDRELKESIRTNGVLIPLVVRTTTDDKLVVVAGHRRLAAVKELISEGTDIPSVPCVADNRHSTDADRTVHLITSNQGKPLTLVEKGEVVKRLIFIYGWTETMVAERIGVTTKQVSNLLELTSVPATIKAMVNQGQVSGTEALRVVRKEGERAPAVLQEALTVAEKQGKGKVTAKTVAQVSPPKATLVSVQPIPEKKLIFPDVEFTEDKFREAVDILHSILLINDLDTVHYYAKDFWRLNT